ncbi:MAG: (2Fe-2S)-binding protein [Candidatus Wallbacteria bacterium]|nr:(2Fe-2S)-binding protein [Candidatus Wallbacteria bacterium]
MSSEQDRDIIICRCEDITEREVRECIRRHGLTTVDEVRKILRAGMGLCQGKTCSALVRRILAEETGKKAEDIGLPSARQPAKPVEFGIFLQEGDR